MALRAPWPVLLAALVSLTTPAEPSQGRAATPEQAIAQLEAAAKAGDLDAFTTLLAEPPRTLVQSMLAVMKRIEAAHTALVRAADARFGQADDPALARHPGESTAQMREDLQRMVSLKIVKSEPEGERVKLQIELTEKPPGGEGTTSRTAAFTAIREAGNWKLLPDEMAGQEGQARAQGMVAHLEKYAGTIEQMVADVRSGKLKTRDELREAVRKAGEGQ